MPGGRILELPGGELQVVERGPAQRQPDRPDPLLHLRDRLVGRDDPAARARATASSPSTCSATAAPRSPTSGYSIPSQADLVAEALGRLGVRDAEVVGHSLGGTGRRSPWPSSRRSWSTALVVIDSIPDTSYGDVGFIGELPFKPVIGQALWRIKPDFAIEDGLEVAFAPGFDVPDAFVEDVKRMTYSAYDRLARRLRRLHRRKAARPSAPRRPASRCWRSWAPRSRSPTTPPRPSPPTARRARPEDRADRRRRALAQRREAGRDGGPRPRLRRAPNSRKAPAPGTKCKSGLQNPRAVRKRP